MRKVELNLPLEKALYWFRNELIIDYHHKTAAWAKTNMIRLYKRSPGGKRLPGVAPRVEGRF